MITACFKVLLCDKALIWRLPVLCVYIHITIMTSWCTYCLRAHTCCPFLLALCCMWNHLVICVQFLSPLTSSCPFCFLSCAAHFPSLLLGDRCALSPVFKAWWRLKRRVYRSLWVCLRTVWQVFFKNVCLRAIFQEWLCFFSRCICSTAACQRSTDASRTAFCGVVASVLCLCL